MSDKKDKIVINVDDEPLLKELAFPDLIRDYKRVFIKEVEYTLKKAATRSAIQMCVETVNADTVVYGGWKSTVIKREAGFTLDIDLLRTNLMKAFKTDAATLSKVFVSSMKPKKMPEPYVKITAPKGELPASPKKDREEEE